MEWLNYHHLLYFWMVARRGSIARACEDLRLAQPTISGQLRALEESLGEKLFVRQGRRLVLTEAGKVVYRYAEEIFTLGNELTDVLKGRPRNRPMRLIVGVSDLIPKLIAYRILAPALSLSKKASRSNVMRTPPRSCWCGYPVTSWISFSRMRPRTPRFASGSSITFSDRPALRSLPRRLWRMSTAKDFRRVSPAPLSFCR